MRFHCTGWCTLFDHYLPQCIHNSTMLVVYSIQYDWSRLLFTVPELRHVFNSLFPLNRFAVQCNSHQQRASQMHSSCRQLRNQNYFQSCQFDGCTSLYVKDSPAGGFNSTNCTQIKYHFIKLVNSSRQCRPKSLDRKINPSRMCTACRLRNLGQSKSRTF